MSAKKEKAEREFIMDIRELTLGYSPQTEPEAVLLGLEKEGIIDDTKRAMDITEQFKSIITFMIISNSKLLQEAMMNAARIVQESASKNKSSIVKPNELEKREFGKGR